LKKITVVKHEYQCRTCRTKYTSIRAAKECESRTREKKIYRVGDLVKNIEPRICYMPYKYQNYIFEGRVIRILGPKPSDYEYEVKWLGGVPERIKGHVFEYEVDYRCPRCGMQKTALYYAPELKKV